MTSPAFDLTRFDVAEFGSITALFDARGFAGGLYVLHFADNEAYAGRSLDVAARFVEDRIQWTDIKTLEFVAWPGDDAERALVELQNVVAQTRTLRVRSAEASEASSTGSAASFPPDRGNRTTILTGPAPELRRKFWELSDHIAYQDLRSIVADYINATIPDPANTQRYLWTVTALPSAARAEGRRRLLALHCGGRETLYVTEFSHDDDESIELEMTVNTDVPTGYSDAQLEYSNDIVTAQRGTDESRDVWSWQIDLGALLSGDDEVDFGIGDDMFDDLAYSLNSRLMQQQGSPSERTHNQDLADDLVAEAYRQLQDAAQG